MTPFHCRICDRIITVPYGMCYECADKDYKDKPKVYSKSISKEQRFDKFGNAICIICGRVARELGKHLKIHGLTEKEYREKYGIKKSVKLSRRTITDEHKKVLSERMKKVRKNCHKTLDSNTNKCYNTVNNGGEPD